MVITKSQGVAITFVIIAFYAFLYFGFVKHSPNAIPLTGFFIVGMLFVFLQKIEEGTSRRLAFFGKLVYDKSGQQITWSDGFCLVPALFPALHYLEVFLLWRLVPLQTSEEVPRQPNIDVHHYVDQRDAHYNVNSQVSFFQQNAARLFGNIMGWFFSFNKRAELRYQGLGSKIVFLALVAGYVSTINLPIISAPSVPPMQILGTQTGQQVTPPVAQQRLATASVVSVSAHVINLAESREYPTFPDTFLFQMTHDPKVQEMYDENGWSYVKYQSLGTKHIPQVTMDRQSCAIVPSGLPIALQSAYPPRFAFNMEDVTYVVSRDKTRGVSRVLALHPDTIVTTSWEELRKDWSLVKVESYVLRTRALLMTDQMSSGRGGLVCF